MQERGFILFFTEDGGLSVWSVKESDFVAELRTGQWLDLCVCDFLSTKTGDTLYQAGVIGHLALGNTNGDVHVWKINRDPNCHTVQLCKHSQFEITALRYNRDASVLASCDRNSITFWAVTTGTLLHRLIFAKNTFLGRPNTMEWNYKSDILALTYTRTGTVLFRVPPQKAMPGIDPINWNATTAQFGSVSPWIRATCVRLTVMGLIMHWIDYDSFTSFSVVSSLAAYVSEKQNNCSTFMSLCLLGRSKFMPQRLLPELVCFHHIMKLNFFLKIVMFQI